MIEGGSGEGVSVNCLGEGCGGGRGMPATCLCKGGHGRGGGGEEEVEEVGGGGGGEEDTAQLGGQDCERGGRDSDGEAEKEETMESSALFVTSSPCPFLSSASRDRIR